eukprot:7386959-Prymnesium_polylepis.1
MVWGGAPDSLLRAGATRELCAVVNDNARPALGQRPWLGRGAGRRAAGGVVRGRNMVSGGVSCGLVPLASARLHRTGPDDPVLGGDGRWVLNVYTHGTVHDGHVTSLAVLHRAPTHRRAIRNQHTASTTSGR